MEEPIKNNFQNKMPADNPVDPFDQINPTPSNSPYPPNPTEPPVELPVDPVVENPPLNDFQSEVPNEVPLEQPNMPSRFEPKFEPDQYNPPPRNPINDIDSKITFSENPKSPGYAVVILGIAVVILLIVTIFLGLTYISDQQQLTEKNNILASYQQKADANNAPRNNSIVNANMVALQKLFISKVLETQGVISDQDRLVIEQAVTDTKDSDVISAWHNFLNSATEKQAQDNIITLLKLLTDKIIY